MSYHVGVCWGPKILGRFVQLQVPHKFCCAPRAPALRIFLGTCPHQLYDAGAYGHAPRYWCRGILLDHNSYPNVTRSGLPLKSNRFFLGSCAMIVHLSTEFCQNRLRICVILLTKKQLDLNKQNADEITTSMAGVTDVESDFKSTYKICRGERQTVVSYRDCDRCAATLRRSTTPGNWGRTW